MTLQFRRGPAASSPDAGSLGEPLFVTDTGELYIGTGTGKIKIGPVTGGWPSGTPSTGDTLQYDGTKWVFAPNTVEVTPGSIGAAEADHTHDYSELTGTPPTGATSLTELTDWPNGVPSQGQILKWNGSQWAFAADATGDPGSSGDATSLEGQTGSHYLNRANHTGTQFASTISDFNDAVAAAAPPAPVDSVAGKTGAVTLDKVDVGLGNVDNTSDLNKPVSTATQAALDLKADTSSLSDVATSGSYVDLTGTPTIPQNINDILSEPSDPSQTATIVWDVASSSWVISQDGDPPAVAGFEFRGFFSAASNPFGSPASPITAVDIVADTDNIIDPPGSSRYAAKITTTFINPAAGGQYPFFAYRWTGDAASDPGWTPLFYDPFFNSIPLSGIVDLGVQSIDLGTGSYSYRVYALSDITQDGGSTVTFLVD